MTVKFVVDDAEAAGVRGDHAVRVRFPEVDRAFALKLLKEGRLRIDGKLASLTSRAKAGSVVAIDIGEGRLGPENIPLFTLLYEDRGLVVVDKTAGVAMHEGPGVHGGADGDDDVLTDALVERFPVEEGFNGPSFLGRLDRPTSGLVVAAFSKAALRDVEPGWREGKIKKEYIVVCHGKAPSHGDIDIPLAARRARLKGTGIIEQALTSFTTVASTKRGSVVVCELHTGRTHQIRRHMKAIGHPIVGDPRYGDARRDADMPDIVSSGEAGLMLHAWRLRHEKAVERLPESIEAPWPVRITSLIKALGLEADPREARRRVSGLAAQVPILPTPAGEETTTNAVDAASAKTTAAKTTAAKTTAAKTTSTKPTDAPRSAKGDEGRERVPASGFAQDDGDDDASVIERLERRHKGKGAVEEPRVGQDGGKTGRR